MGLNHLSYLTSEQKAQMDQLRVGSDKLLEDIKAGRDVDRNVIAQTITQAKSVGDTEQAANLATTAAHIDDYKAIRGLNDEQRVQRASAISGDGLGAGGSEKQALDFFQSKGWSQAQAAGIVGNLVRESGLRAGALNPGDGSDGSDSIGIAQWNGTRAAALRQFAAQQGRSVNDFSTQLAFVQHELETSEGSAAQQLRGATTPQDAAAKFALGYERPQGFMTGSIQQVAGGADRVNNAVRLAGGGATSDIVAPGSPLPGGGRRPVITLPSAADIASNPATVSTYSDLIRAQDKADIESAKHVGEAAAVQLGAGNLPNPTTMAGLQQLAHEHPQELGDIVQKVNAKFQGIVGAPAFMGGRDAAATLTPAQGQAYADQVERQAQGGPIFKQMRARAVSEFIKKGSENLKSDQFGEAAQRGWIMQAPQPIDLTQPDTLPAAIAQHASAAVAIGAHTQNAETSIFAENELPAIKSVFSTGSMDQRVAMASAISNANLPAPVLKATLGQLGKSEATMPLAVAGSIAKDNPGAAHDIIQGQALMGADPKLAPNHDDFPSAFATKLPFNDLPGPETRKGLDAGIQAAYAKASADANDTTGILNQTRLDKAVDDVTGGLAKYRGATVLGPWYGAGQPGLDGALRSLTDADFAKSRLQDGSTFPASALQSSLKSAFTLGNGWRLQTLGAGKYLVFSGADSNRQYLGDDKGGKFILDLGAKRQQAERAGLSLAPSNMTTLYNSAVMGGGN